MILSALLAMSWLQSPKALEIPDANSSRVAFVAVVKRSSVADEEEAYWRLLAEALTMGTMRYSPAALRQANATVWCGPDHLGLRVSIPKEAAALGADMLAEMVCRPLLPEEETKRLLEEAPYRREDLWQHGLRGRAMWRQPLNYEAFRTFANRVLRPESVKVVVAGGFQPGSTTDLFSSRWDFAAAPAGREPLYSREKKAVPATALEYGLLEGPEAPPDTLGRQMAVAFALGVGKGSPAYLIWREKLGLSYRQEVFVEPSPKGFRIKAMLARAPKEGDPLGETMKSSFKTAIEAMTEADLERTQSVARLCLNTGILPSPLYFAPDQVLGDGPEGVASLAALGLAKTGRPIVKASLLGEIESMTLKDLKEACQEFIDQCVAEVRFAK